ncbi:hypothetical protein [Occallatibacter riparius]|uniref:Uncharacterized protein n=1 Tax=Occallatibacter riparius TaxID=1002689 RepID=A0A9J7BSN4_9BACT|nr:hypothetical protein [Occallatibacter riparius]UWZ84037.1 hypothetical protein MOP44_26200 [Occallatibacter riparius]
MPNGYALLMIDVTDQGTVYNPATQIDSSSVSTRDDAVFGVRQLQVDRNLIYGGQDTKSFEHMGQESEVVDRYFELDTTHHTHWEFDSYDALQSRASSRGVALRLRPFYEVYSEYRFTAFDYTAFAILILVPLASFLVLVSWIWRIRRSGLRMSQELRLS